MQKDKLVKTLKRNSSFFKPFAFSDLARCAVKAESKRLVQSSFSTCLPAPQKKDKQACVSSRCHPSLTAFYHTLHCLSIRQKDFLQIFCISPWRDGDLVLSVLQYDGEAARTPVVRHFAACGGHDAQLSAGERTLERVFHRRLDAHAEEAI